MSNNQLVFKVYGNSNDLLVLVECHEGVGAKLTFTPNFDKFKENHEVTSKNLCRLLDALDDVFKAGDVDNDIELVRMTMSMIEGIPFGFALEYIEDTVSSKLVKPAMPDYKITPFPMPASFFEGNGFMDETLNNFMLGSSKPPKKVDEPKKNKRTSLTFDDVVGMHEVKEKLQDVISQFKNAEKYKAWNIKPIKGIVLYGPSGTGKSYISEAFANEIDAEFFPLSSADIISKYLGESGKAIRSKFEEARKHPLSIIYIDEVDAIAAKRDGSENNKERNATLNELLVQMASPENDNVIMIFATNMLDLLDPAFLRSGRCDFKIEVPLPDFDCRKGILELNSKGRPLADDVDFDKLARNMSGMNCADMAQVANEGARIALKQNKDQIDMCDFEQAFEEMVCGLQTKTKQLSELEKDYVAIHETGHLFANEVYKVNKTKKISILPRGTTLGFVMHVNEEDNDKWLHSKDELLNQIKVCLAGRAAEDVFYGDVTTGASNDLEKANKIANNMVTQYAFVEELGLSTFDMRNPFSLTIVQKYVDAILRDCYAEVKQMIIENKDNIREFANVLKEKEEMVLEEIMETLNLETAE